MEYSSCCEINYYHNSFFIYPLFGKRENDVEGERREGDKMRKGRNRGRKKEGGENRREERIKEGGTKKRRKG